jgi:hypothetical protein
MIITIVFATDRGFYAILLAPFRTNRHISCGFSCSGTSSSYSYLDETVARFAQIFSRLRGEAFRDYSLSYHVHDLWLAIALSARIHPDISMDAAAGKARDVTRDLNRLRVEAYGRAIELALQGKGFLECGGLVRETKNAAMEIQGRADAVARSILARLSRPARIYSPMKTAAAYVLNFCLAGASLSGCYASSPHRPGDASQEEERDLAVDPHADAADAAEEPRACSSADVEAIKEEVR